MVRKSMAGRGKNERERERFSVKVGLRMRARSCSENMITRGSIKTALMIISLKTLGMMMNRLDNQVHAKYSQ